VFTEVLKFVDRFIAEIFSDNVMTPFVKELKIILVSSITIYIIYKAYLIWAGKIQDPVRDVIWDLGTKSVIINLKLYKRILS